VGVAVAVIVVVAGAVTVAVAAAVAAAVAVAVAVAVTVTVAAVVSNGCGKGGWRSVLKWWGVWSWYGVGIALAVAIKWGGSWEKRWWVVGFSWRKHVGGSCWIGRMVVSRLGWVLLEGWWDRVVRNVCLTAYTCLDPPRGGVS
jgi:hypothetical protein